MGEHVDTLMVGNYGTCTRGCMSSQVACGGITSMADDDCIRATWHVSYRMRGDLKIYVRILCFAHELILDFAFFLGNHRVVKVTVDR